MHIKSHPKPWAVSGVWRSQRVFKVRVPPWAPEGSAVFAVFLAPRRPRAFLGSGGRCWFSGSKKRPFKAFLIVRGCFWVRVPPLAGSRFWQFFGFLIIFAFLELQNGQIELPKGPGRDLPESAPFAFVPHKEFINKNSIFVLLDFGFNDQCTVLKLPVSEKHVSPRENDFGSFQSCQNGRLGGAAVTANVRTLNPPSLELLCASGRLQLGEKHLSPREIAFGSLQSCQNGRLGGAAVTAKVRTLNPLSLELLCAYWKLQLGGKHVSPREITFGSLQSCKNGRLGGAAVTAKV